MMEVNNHSIVKGNWSCRDSFSAEPWEPWWQWHPRHPAFSLSLSLSRISSAVMPTCWGTIWMAVCSSTSLRWHSHVVPTHYRSGSPWHPARCHLHHARPRQPRTSPQSKGQLPLWSAPFHTQKKDGKADMLHIWQIPGILFGSWQFSGYVSGC